MFLIYRILVCISRTKFFWAKISQKSLIASDKYAILVDFELIWELYSVSESLLPKVNAFYENTI